MKLNRRSFLVVLAMLGIPSACLAETYSDEFLSFEYRSEYSVVVKVDQPAVRVLALQAERPAVVLTQGKLPGDHLEARQGMIQVALNGYKSISIPVTSTKSPPRVADKQTLFGERLSLKDGAVTQDFYSLQIKQLPLVIVIQSADDPRRSEAIELFFKSVQFVVK